jgi:hypothetical protein
MTRRLAALVLLLIGIAGCRKPAAHAVEDLHGAQDLSGFALSRLHGTRDGDALQARALYTDGSGGQLRVELHFRVGVPTRLESGTWHGLGSEGRVAERSVTFLGGQSAAPSLGGKFNLLGPDGSPRYAITVPLQPLTRPF